MELMFVLATCILRASVVDRALRFHFLACFGDPIYAELNSTHQICKDNTVEISVGYISEVIETDTV